MEAVNQQAEPPSTGNLRGDRAASAMYPAPVQTLEQGAQLRRRQTYHAVLDRRPLEPPDSSLLAIRHSPVPSHQTSLIRSLRLARNT